MNKSLVLVGMNVRTTAALLFEEKGIESAYSQIFSATSDRIGNVLQLALNEQL
jgi:hypothetical protein